MIDSSTQVYFINENISEDSYVNSIIIRCPYLRSSLKYKLLQMIFKNISICASLVLDENKKKRLRKHTFLGTAFFPYFRYIPV